MGKLASYPKIHSFLVGNTVALMKNIPENKHRKALLIQNLSGNIIYIKTIKSEETTGSIQLDNGQAYENNHYCQGEYWLLASAASSTVRVEEDCQP